MEFDLFLSFFIIQSYKIFKYGLFDESAFIYTQHTHTSNPILTYTWKKKTTTPNLRFFPDLKSPVYFWNMKQNKLQENVKIKVCCKSLAERFQNNIQLVVQKRPHLQEAV